MNCLWSMCHSWWNSVQTSEFFIESHTQLMVSCPFISLTERNSRERLEKKGLTSHKERNDYLSSLETVSVASGKSGIGAFLVQWR